MRKMIKSIMTAAVIVAATCAHGFSLPLVGTGTELNKWSRNMSGVLAAAKTTGYPILLVMINDSSSGEGCSHCKLFVERTLNTSEFTDIVNSYKFYMVLMNLWGSGTGSSQPQYGGVSSAVFFEYFDRYASDRGYPVVSVIRPDGTKYKGWGDSTNPSTRGMVMCQLIRQAIADLSTSSTEFSLTAQSGNTVTVDAAAAKTGTWTGVVTRSGDSGATGTVLIELSGANKSNYEINPATFKWGTDDGAKTFTLTGPQNSDGGIISDTLVVSISANGFSGSDISYGTTSQTVTFKDSRVKQSLDEFADAKGVQRLAASGGRWYVPAQNDGNVLETMTSSSSILEFTAAAGGILTVGTGTDNPGKIEVTANGETHELVGDVAERFGVAAGDKIRFKASVGEGSDNTVVGFTRLEFKPLTVSLSSPANGAQISYDTLVADKSCVDMGWSANRSGCVFALTCNGTKMDMGAETSLNGVDAGLVSVSPETKAYSWMVSAAYTDEDLQGTAVGTANAAFSVVSLPSYGNIPEQVQAYKGVPVSMDFSVASAGAGKVTYTANGLPRGLKINSSTGLVTGTPKSLRKSSVTVTAANDFGSVSAKFTLVVSKLPKSLYGKLVCFYFNGAGDIEASAYVNITSSGKWTGKLTENGSSKTIRGELKSLVNGSVSIASGNVLNITRNPSTGIWSGSGSSRTVYGKAIEKAVSPWKGTWNGGVATSSDAKLGGYITAKVASSGQITCSGSISSKQKLSGKSYSAVFPAAFVAENLPRWSGHGDVRFGHFSKSGMANGGCVLYADGKLGGSFTLRSVRYDEIEGSKWSKGSLAALNGATFRTSGGGDVSIPVVVNSGKLSAGRNDYDARISATSNSGIVKVSYTSGGRSTASGVLYKVNGTLKAFGGGSSGTAGAFTFVIE